MANYLQTKYGLRGGMVEMTEVKRQSKGSSILATANELRRNMEAKRLATPKWIGEFFKGEEGAVKLYLARFEQGQHERVAILSLGNAYRDRCNAHIRQSLGLTGRLSVNDTVVLNQNHVGQHYVANGEVGVIKAIDSKRHRVADLEFAEAEIAFKDENDAEFSIVSLVLLDELAAPITKEQRKALFAAEMRQNRTFQKSQDSRDSLYLSALQLSYGHALTVHKAQGSEWDSIIMNTAMYQLDLRFLYTGITRARKELFTNSAHCYAASDCLKTIFLLPLQA